MLLARRGQLGLVVGSRLPAPCNLWGLLQDPNSDTQHLPGHGYAGHLSVLPLLDLNQRRAADARSVGQRLLRHALGNAQGAKVFGDILKR